MGLIYMRTSPENKSYIGLTMQPEALRWSQHCNQAYNINSSQYNSKLSQAIRKYGASNFTLQILDECEEDQLSIKEQYWIQYYDTYYNGYNETLGGEGFWKYHTEDMMKLWNEGYNKLEIASIIGCDEKTVRNHLNSIISKKDSYIRGQQKKKPIIEKIQFILALWNQGYSIQEIKEKSQISAPTISKHLKLNGITQEAIISRSREKQNNAKKKAIIQYDSEKNIIAEYESLQAASKQLNIDVITLKNIIKGASKKYTDIILHFKEQV